MQNSGAGSRDISPGGFHRVRRWIRGLKPWQVLLAMYALFSVLRALIAVYTTATPVVQPDEALYLHLSHSIIRRGELLFRGQPIHYEYILYPLLLSPLHLLPENISMFRAIQVFNALAMNLAVFPAYALAKDITGRRSYGLLIALLTLLMPDLFMTRHVMAESVGFPLTLAACWAFYTSYDAPPRFRTALLWGAMGFLLYALKPGLLALPACFYLMLGFRAIRQRKYKRLLHALSSVLILVCFYGAYRMLLIHGLRMPTEQLSLYQSQTHPFDLAHIIQVINGLFVYGLYVPLAFAFFPLLFPLSHLRAFAPRQRDMLAVFGLALLATVLGTVYVIYYDEVFKGADPYAARIHIRYLSAFLPVMTAFLFSPALEGRRVNAPLAAGLSFIAAGIILLGPLSTASGRAFNTDALLLAAAAFKTDSFNARLIWPAAALSFAAAMIFLIHRRGWEGACRRLTLGFLICSFLCSGAVAAWHYRYHEDSIYPGTSAQAAALTDGLPSLGVVRDGGFFWPEAIELDLASRFGMPVIELDDLIENALADGSAGTFIPKAYWQEQPAYALDAPVCLVFVGETLNRIVLSRDLMMNSRVTEDSAYVVARAVPGAPLLHSGLSGFSEGWVKDGSRFTLFDPALRANGTIKLRLQARMGDGEGSLLLSCGGQTARLPLTSSLGWVEASFAVDDPDLPVTVYFSASGGNGQVYVETYLIE